MSKHDPTVRLLHMRDHAQEAISIARGRARVDLDSDRKLQLALMHLVTVIGEAASQVPMETQEQYSQIAWRKVTGMRHRLVHGYASVNLDLLWDTITNDLPSLIATLQEILKED